MIYKILTAEEWASRKGALPWAPVDIQDGFIHFSTAAQVEETARRHFAEELDLVLVRVEPSLIPEAALRWEASRGGALFPHVYGDVPLEAVAHVWRMEGEFRMPTDLETS